MGICANKTLFCKGKPLNICHLVNLKMRKTILLLTIFCFAFAATTTFTSCSPKVGCELNEGLGPKTNKKGELSTKRGKSSLFDKKKRKRMGY